MGDLRSWSLESNGVVVEEKPSSSSSSLLFSSNPTVIGADYWRKAEEATQAIISQVQPTIVSEKRRKSVIDYVQRLIRDRIGCEVFPFGSVPLKTYLPDGDIDLTAFGGTNVEEALASDVCSVLNGEDQNEAAEFVVKDVQLIRAEVKLVKCLVQNIVVDISFNQLGGLCTLCFLEQIDRLIGKDHLFKRSIILIKAWCYYESRILGAHHGLISTYALETLVLYIFHLFHSALNGPLEVLYKFLDYFSKFDWDNYCISLNGPVRISSLPELVAETPENGGGDLLLSTDFLKSCVEMFSVPSRGYETNSRVFPTKHLNIVDPLKENNNLGRSVSKGNFYRIRSAFSYGARKLGCILSHPEENIMDEVGKFFSNTLDRHGGGQRPDVQDPVPMCTDSQEEQSSCDPGSERASGTVGECTWSKEGSLYGGNVNVKIPGKQDNVGRMMNEFQGKSFQVGPLSVPSDIDGLANGIAISDYRLSGDANDLASLRIEGLTISHDARKCSHSNFEESMSPSGQVHHAPHLYFSRPVLENGELKDGNTNTRVLENSDLTEKKSSYQCPQTLAEETGSTARGKQDEDHATDNDEMTNQSEVKRYSSPSSSVSLSSEDFYPGYRGHRFPTGNVGAAEAFNSLSDLKGDYENHLNSLQVGRWCYDYAFSAALSPMPPPLPSQYSNKNPWDIVRRSVQVKQNAFTQMNSNGLLARPAFYPIRPPILPGGATLGIEEMPKPRGTGTYFPNMNHYRDRPSSVRGRNQVPVRSPRHNGRSLTPLETNMPEKSSQDSYQIPTVTHGGGAFTSCGNTSGSPVRKLHHNGNGAMPRPERAVEFGSFGHVQTESPIDCSREQNSIPTFFQNSGLNDLSPKMQKAKHMLNTDQDRLSMQMHMHMQSYELKDEEDFPPLSN